jgi:hypothetical protein
MRRSLLKSKKLKNLIPKKILEGLIFESIVGSRLNETHDDKNSDFDIIGISLIKDINDALPYYKNLGYGDENTPVMDKYYKEAFSLPIYPLLSEEEQEYVIKTLFEVLNE